MCIQLTYLQWRSAWTCSEHFVHNTLILILWEEWILLSRRAAQLCQWQTDYPLSKQTCFMEMQGGFVAEVSVWVRQPKLYEPNSPLGHLLKYGTVGQRLQVQYPTPIGTASAAGWVVDLSFCSLTFFICVF